MSDSATDESRGPVPREPASRDGLTSGVTAMVAKEFRQMRRDRRTLALLILMPVMMLIIFGYAARFDVTSVDTVVVGADADRVGAGLPDLFDVVSTDAGGDRVSAEADLRDGRASAAVVTGGDGTLLLLDGADLFVAQSVMAHVPPGMQPEVLFNPSLSTSAVMIPSLIGLILLFVGTVITSLGVVREREQGTLEQLAVMPLRPVDVIVGKITPYFLVSVLDMAVITIVGVTLFDVPFRGSVVMLIVFGLVYLIAVLGLGVAISTVSRSQGEAIQLAIMVLLPQVMLSGMIFPLESMAAGVRWIGYLLPLTYFSIGMRDIFLRGASLGALLVPLGALVAMAVVVLVVSVVRFRRELSTNRARDGRR
ncbi:MAG: ABC transporter permease [Acidimicrobiales bacterium]